MNHLSGLGHSQKERKNIQMIPPHLELELHGLQCGGGLDGPGASVLCHLARSNCLYQKSCFYENVIVFQNVHILNNFNGLVENWTYLKHLNIVDINFHDHTSICGVDTYININMEINIRINT